MALNSGLCFYTDVLRAGLSVNQLLEDQWQPFEQITTLPLHLNLFAVRDFRIRKTILTPSARMRLLKDFNHNFDINLTVLIQKVLKIGTGYRHFLYKNKTGGDINNFGLQAGMIFHAGVSEVDIQYGKVSLTVSYHIPSMGNPNRFNTLEFAASYRFQNK